MHSGPQVLYKVPHMHTRYDVHLHRARIIQWIYCWNSFREIGNGFAMNQHNKKFEDFLNCIAIRLELITEFFYDSRMIKDNGKSV